MDADNNFSDMKIILEPYDSVTDHHLSGIYSKIVVDNITSVHDLFDTEDKTNTFIKLFIEQLQTEYQIFNDNGSSQLLTDLLTAVDKPNYDMSTLGQMALNQIDSDLAKYYLRSDASESDTHTGNFTYGMLIDALITADESTYNLFIQMMPDNAVLPSTYTAFQAAVSDQSISGVIITALNNAGYINTDDVTTARALSFGDITEADMKTFISDQMSTQAGSFLAAFMNIDADNVFDSNDGLFDVLNTVLLSGNATDLEEIGFHIQRLGIDGFNSNQSTYINNSTVSANINSLLHLLSYRASLITLYKPSLLIALMYILRDLIVKSSLSTSSRKN